MLLQSHEGSIQILPALPKAWHTGHFDGLVARGNFVISAKWKDAKATELSILSRSGGECQIAHPDIGNATVTDSSGNTVEATRDGKDRVHFASQAGEKYTIAMK